MSLADMRRDYMQRGLSEGDIDPDPLVQFRAWLDQALAANLTEPNAMTVATVGADGHPSARMVLLKGVDTGFIFYTNYESRKGRELAGQPWAALILYWAELERQVRIEGAVETLPPEASDAYFHSRPRGSQLSAAVSPQSQVIPGREVLEARVQELTEQYQDQEIPRPAHWGGYRVVPTTIEFWQGRPSRLHDRLRYQRQLDGTWQIVRLAP
jgi:pyridoxamine 5'-phosphate oxidase